MAQIISAGQVKYACPPSAQKDLNFISALLTINPLSLDGLHGFKWVSPAGRIDFDDDDGGVLALVGNIEKTLCAFNIPHSGYNRIVWQGDVMVKQSAANALAV